MNIAEPFVRQALTAPNRMALVIGQQTLTYGQLLSVVRRLAASLQKVGVSPQDRVALAVSAPGGNVALCLALACIGAISVGLPGSTPVIEGSSERLGVKFLIHNRAEDFALQYPALQRQLRFDDLLASTQVPPPWSMSQVDPKDVWRVMMSTGTTGVPKGILCSHAATVAQAYFQRLLLPTAPDDRVMIAMDVRMGFATNTWIKVLYAGACAFLYTEQTPLEIIRTIHESGITQLVTIPTVAISLANLVAQPDPAYPLPSPSLRLMTLGGAAISPRLRDVLRRHVCKSLYVNLGSTEAGLVATLDPALHDQHSASAGRLMPWVEAQAVDATGSPLAHGETGALRIRSPTMCHGYAGEVRAPGEPDPFRDGWFYSNDVGSVSVDGLVFLAGRANDVINISGYKIDPALVEAAIAQDPAVLECVAVDVLGPLDQPMLVAVIVAREEVDIESLNARCGRVGRGCVPLMVLHADKLPRNAAGKILRDEVRRNIHVRASNKPMGGHGAAGNIF